MDRTNATDETDGRSAEGAGAYFNEAAATWDDNPMHVELATAVAKGIQAAIPLTADMVVMDFGCGTGLITRALAPEVASVVATDTSPQMLATLETRAKASGLMNIQPLPIDPGYQSADGSRVDAIVSSMVFHHIDDIPALLSRFAEWVRPAGWIAIADLEPEDGSFHPKNRHVVHLGIDPIQLGSQLGSAGFSIQSVQTIHTIRRQSEGADKPRDYPVFLLVARSTRPEAAT